MHVESLARFGTNIHGHLHYNRVKKTISVEKTSEYDPRPFTVQEEVIDPRYHCVCVEHTDYRPILFENVIKRIELEGGTVGFKNGNGPVM